MSIDRADKIGFSLTGRKALVTGGATGIGKAIAVGLASCGADVAITTNRHAGDQTVHLIREFEQRGFELHWDLQGLDKTGADNLVASASDQLGGLDILVNNAGIIRREDALAFGECNWRDVMATNLDAVWFLSQAAARRMAPSGGGAIISIASLLSFQGGVRVPSYAAAKHGVVGITKALANELAAKNVRVNAIAPGYIATDNTLALREDRERNQQILQRIPAGRWGEPEDIAGAVVFLASDAARYVHGSVLAVDGGWLSR